MLDRVNNMVNLEDMKKRFEIGESLTWRSPYSRRDVAVEFRGWLIPGVKAIVVSATGWHHHTEVAHLRRSEVKA